jgi:hypothetical protein
MFVRYYTHIRRTTRTFRAHDCTAKAMLYSTYKEMLDEYKQTTDYHCKGSLRFTFFRRGVILESRLCPVPSG